jgi:hypothetical protein
MSMSKRVIVFGGDGRPMPVEGLDPSKAKVRYIADSPTKAKGVADSIKSGGVDVVYLLARFISHKHEARIISAARRAKVPYIRTGPARSGKEADTKPRIRPVIASVPKVAEVEAPGGRRQRRGFQPKATTWPQFRDFTSQRAWIISLLATEPTLNSAEVEAIAAAQGVWQPPVDSAVGLARASALIQWWRRRKGYDMCRMQLGGTPPGGFPANYLPPELEHLREVLEG